MLHSALLLLLVFAQQQSIAHQISHAAPQSSQQDPARDSTKYCEKCLALAHLGDSLPVAALIIVPEKAGTSPPLAVVIVERQPAFFAYRSRAPPPVL